MDVPFWFWYVTAMKKYKRSSRLRVKTFVLPILAFLAVNILIGQCYLLDWRSIALTAKLSVLVSFLPYCEGWKLPAWSVSVIVWLPAASAIGTRVGWPAVIVTSVEIESP